MRTVSFPPLERLLRYARKNSYKFAGNVLSTSFAAKITWRMIRGKRQECDHLIQQQFERDVLCTGELAREIERSINEIENSTKLQREAFASQLLFEILRTPEFQHISSDELRKLYDEVLRTIRNSPGPNRRKDRVFKVLGDDAVRSIARAAATAAVADAISRGIAFTVVTCVASPGPSLLSFVLEYRARKRIEAVTVKELDRMRDNLTSRLRQELLKVEAERHRQRKRIARELIAHLRERNR